MKRVWVYLYGVFAIGWLAGCQSPSADLARQLCSENPAQRAAGCVRAARLGDSSVLPLLVERLQDEAEEVRLCAIQSLQRLSGQTLGYKYYYRQDQRQLAVERWRSWLRQRAASQPAGAVNQQ